MERDLHRSPTSDGSDRNASTRAREEAVFARFANVCPLPIVATSIALRPPPEPDVLCTVEGEGALAFELVDIVDEGMARLVGEQIRLKGVCTRWYHGLDSVARATFNQKFGDAVMAFFPNWNISRQARSRAIRFFLERVCEVPIPHTGPLDLTPFSRDVQQGLYRVVVARGVRGPVFDVVAAGSFGHPILQQLRKKLQQKRYESPHPVELLAYYDLQPVTPEDTWLPDVESYVKEQLSSSPFRRVWLFDVHEERIIWSYPPVAPQQR